MVNNEGKTSSSREIQNFSMNNKKVANKSEQNIINKILYKLLL